MFAVAIAVAAALCLFIFISVVDVFIRFRGPRVVYCANHNEWVTIELDALRASVGVSRLRVRECARWPERSGCDQRCLSGVDRSAAQDHGLLTRALPGGRCS